MFLGQGFGPVCIHVYNRSQLNARECAEHSRVITTKRTNPHHSRANAVHKAGSRGAYDITAMLASFARFRNSSLSIRRVRPASKASAVVWVCAIVAIVVGPTTGTSKSRWARPLDAFARRSGLPPVS